jgi:hypothetical protein
MKFEELKLTDVDWEKVNKRVKRDILSMVLDFQSGRIGAGDLCDLINARCEATAHIQLAKVLAHLKPPENLREEIAKRFVVAIREDEPGCEDFTWEHIGEGGKETARKHADYILALFAGWKSPEEVEGIKELWWNKGRKVVEDWKSPEECKKCEKDHEDEISIMSDTVTATEIRARAEGRREVDRLLDVEDRYLYHMRGVDPDVICRAFAAEIRQAIKEKK